MSTKRDYYEVLGLSRTATEEEIKKAYRKLSMKLHPDRVPAEEKEKAELAFKEMKEAYECLSDTNKRARYDRFGHTEPTGNPFGNTYTYSGTTEDISDILKNMFGSQAGHPFDDLFGHRTQGRSQQRRVITISLENAYEGCTANQPDIKIQIPAGTRHGTKFVHNGIIYQINILPHRTFQRSNDDLLVDVEISAIEAMLGIEATLAHLDKSQLQFTIPAGIQGGQIVRLAGKGMKNPETDRFGDLLVRIHTSIPKNLTDEQREVLKANLVHRTSFNI